MSKSVWFGPSWAGMVHSLREQMSVSAVLFSSQEDSHSQWTSVIAEYMNSGKVQGLTPL